MQLARRPYSIMSTKACKQNRDEVAHHPCRALYVHVPFCKAKCRYCGFYSVRCETPAACRYVHAAGIELTCREAELSDPLASVYVGGGTPTALGAELLAELLSRWRPRIDEATEFSVEANPGTLDEGIARALAAAGVNRVNVGVQSFRDEELRLLGRVHSAEEARRAVEVLRAAKIHNVGLDLIYGIPGQTLDSWQASVAEGLALRPEHLSCYCLSFEPGTPLEADLRAGRVQEMDEAVQEACFRHAIAACEESGLQHYEISNFARPGRRCRQNVTYWRNEPYLGIGPGAVSYLRGVRRKNLPDVDAYVRALSAGHPAPASQEELTGRAAMAEAVMLSLRLREGLDRASFAARYGCDVVEAFPGSLRRHVEFGSLEVTAKCVRIASKSLFVADTILADILAEA